MSLRLHTPNMCQRIQFLILLYLLSPAVASYADETDIASITSAVNAAHKRFSPDRSGELPDYIPALRAVNPEPFGIAVVTVNNDVITIGDVDQSFAIMSVAKVFTLASVLETHGSDTIRKAIGVEPTGFPFNSILAIELNKARSINPLVNAGAIATVSLLPGVDDEQRWQRLLGFYNRMAASELEVMDAVYDSVATTGYRNRAIANLLRSYNRLYREPDGVLDIYNRQSSVAVTAQQLAMMGATLANGGVNPLTAKRLIKEDNVPKILSLMTMAGLYDEAGEWSYTVGLPAKSGVGGGIVAIIPGKMAIATFSPRLNKAGNSVRGLASIKHIAKSLSLGVFEKK